MAQQVNKKNLRTLCWQRGFHGVAGLAREIKRNRSVIHHAVNNPNRYGPTIRLLNKTLLGHEN